MVWTFIAGMLCGVVLLILAILISDRSFLDLLMGRFAAEPVPRPQEPEPPGEKQHTMAVGSDS
jgi:Na+-transporting methylmalonyl-CoA/oxaloacetate decarboxylase gamma subunit